MLTTGPQIRIQSDRIRIRQFGHFGYFLRKSALSLASMSKRFQSPVWLAFKRLSPTLAECKACTKTLTIPGDGSTSNLINHINTHKPMDVLTAYQKTMGPSLNEFYNSPRPLRITPPQWAGYFAINCSSLDTLSEVSLNLLLMNHSVDIPSRYFSTKYLFEHHVKFRNWVPRFLMCRFLSELDS